MHLTDSIGLVVSKAIGKPSVLQVYSRPGEWYVMPSLVGKVKDILLDLESERLKRERLACEASMTCMVQIAKSLERLRMHILANKRRACRADASGEARLEGSLKGLYKNAVHTQGCFIERMLPQYRSSTAESTSRYAREEEISVSLDNCPKCSILCSLVALAKDIANKGEMLCSGIISRKSYALPGSRVHSTCNATENEDEISNRTPRGEAEDSAESALEESSHITTGRLRHGRDTLSRIKLAHRRLIQHVECRTASLCEALFPYYTRHKRGDSRQEAWAREESMGKHSDNCGQKSGELQARHSIDVLYRNIKKHEEHASSMAHALLMDVLSQGTIRDDERFLGILEDTVARFENLENSDFLRLSVQFNLARKYVADIVRLKKGCSVLVCSPESESRDSACH